MGYAQSELPAGPGEVTVRNIELRKVPRPRAATLSQLDKSFRWTPGTALAYLTGERPPSEAEREVTDLAIVELAAGLTDEDKADAIRHMEWLRDRRS